MKGALIYLEGGVAGHSIAQKILKLPAHIVRTYPVAHPSPDFTTIFSFDLGPNLPVSPKVFRVSYWNIRLKLSFAAAGVGLDETASIVWIIEGLIFTLGVGHGEDAAVQTFNGLRKPRDSLNEVYPFLSGDGVFPGAPANNGHLRQ